MVKRICVIALPRTGSTYVCEFLSKVLNLDDINEPLTPGQTAITVIDDNRVKREFDDKNKAITLEDRTRSFMKNLPLIDKNQSLVLKLFLNDSVDYPGLIDVIKQHGFEFVIIRRNNIEEQLLSHLIAANTNRWGCTDKEYVRPKITINADNFDVVKYNYQYISDFNKNLLLHDIHGAHITYENMESDLLKYCGLPKSNLPVLGNYKLSLGDPYEHIINKDEVKRFITELLNGT